jgi:hypothetical protein
MASTRRGFVTGGTWCVDLNKMIDFWPPEDSIAEIRQIDMRGGGSASNLAIDMKKLDPAMPVETIGIVGDDENGRFLLRHADSFGIDRRQMAVTKELPTQFTDCFGSKRTGRRTHIYYPGAAALLTPDHFDFAETSGRIFHLGLPGIHKLLDGPWQGDANGWVTVLKKAKAAGLTTKSSIIVGMGETYDEVVECMADLRAVGVDIVTVGQYLRPTADHVPVARWWTPDEFAALARVGEDELGIPHVEASPLTRSSYHAKTAAARSVAR